MHAGDREATDLERESQGPVGPSRLEHGDIDARSGQQRRRGGARGPFPTTTTEASLCKIDSLPKSAENTIVIVRSSRAVRCLAVLTRDDIR